MKVCITIIGLAALFTMSCISECMAAGLEFGPYGVGFNSYKTHDSSRRYILGDDTIARPLLIHFWFPTEKNEERQALKFKDYIDLIAQREDFGKSKPEIDNQSYYYVKGYSDFAKNNFGLDTSISANFLLESPVYARSCNFIPGSGTKYPLLIYAPSNSKASVQNHMLCEYLASHGFMIISVASAGPNSIERKSFRESTMAQVTDMEYILKYCEDSLKINYEDLGLFGFSSGGNAMSIFQMRNKKVGALLSLDGGQEYSTFMGLYTMPDFDLEKATVPYLSLVNNYENFSIYPMYHSIQTTEKYLFRMSCLDHNGFISYWSYFDSCSPGKIMSNTGIGFEYLSECAVRFFSKYLKHETDKPVTDYSDEHAKKYIESFNRDYSNITALCKALLNNDLDSASSLVDQHKEEFFGEANQVNLLARMFTDSQLAEWLYQKCVEYQPESWEAYYDLGYYYKERGEILQATTVLSEARKLHPGNSKVTELLIELEKME